MVRYDVCIIGAGASGMICAIEAAKAGKSVIIFDKNKKCGNKLYATGNGKCNLANTYLDKESYFNKTYVSHVLGDNPCDFIISYFNKLGVKTYDKSGYIYPMSNQASTVVWALTDKLRQLGVEIRTKSEIIEIRANKEGFTVYCEEQNMVYSEKLVVSCGGIASPSLGSATETIIYKLFKELKVSYKEFEPALCPVILDKPFQEANGVRNVTNARLFSGNKLIGSETGELQITDYGLSGIMIFNLSGYMNRDKKYSLQLDFIPDVSEDEILKSYNYLKLKEPKRSILAFLNGYVNDKLALYLLKEFDTKYGIDLTKKTVEQISLESIKKLICEVKGFETTIKAKADFDKSQSTLGGVLLSKINPESMSYIDKNNLYITGEACDVCGKCGGYNLMWAFITGYKAGRSIGGRND